jgi:hypothetical protein
MLVRGLFLLLVPALLVQYALVRSSGEPYPALMMPGFPGSGGWIDGKLTLRQVDIVAIAANGREFAFSPQEFLRDFDEVIRLVVVHSYFSPLEEAGAGPDAARSKLKQLGRKLFPRLHGGKRNRTAAANVAAQAEWIRRRTALLLPSEAIARVEFRWFTTTVGSDPAQPPSPRESAGTYLVSLEGRGP